MNIYSYCVRYDSGAAPNPFYDLCTLAICKPGIRKFAKVNDWILGHGSVERGSANKVIYIMQVQAVMDFIQYDWFCRNFLPNKIPDVLSRTYERRVGDCIYDASLKQRESVHDKGNRKNDLSGKYVLLSRNFIYFGRSGPILPSKLQPMLHNSQGFKKQKNSQLIDEFQVWVAKIKRKHNWNKCNGRPELREELISKNFCNEKFPCEKSLFPKNFLWTT